MTTIKTYFVIVKFGSSHASTQDKGVTRWLQASKEIKDRLEKLSKGDFQFAFSSSTPDVFGCFINADMPAAKIRARVMNAPGDTRNIPDSALRNTDSCLVFEVGPDFTGDGMSNAWTWLQHHHSTCGTRKALQKAPA